MIRYILKLWSNNTDFFAEAVRLRRDGVIDGVELYNNVKEPLDWAALEALKDANVITIHNPHSHGWHDFFLSDEQKAHWEQTKKLADFFSSRYVIIHPARTHDKDTFFKQLEQLEHLNENRIEHLNNFQIIIENMAGLDIDRQPMQYGVTLDELKEISTQAPICFDLEKAVKGAASFPLLPEEGPSPSPQTRRAGVVGAGQEGYKAFIVDALAALRPTYFHISGGDAADAMDQHFNLWEGNIDMQWMKQTLAEYGKDKDIFLAFETPKMDGLANDVKNMLWFREV